jgi:hypothetical protein
VENQASLRLAQEGRFGFAAGNLGAMLGLTSHFQPHERRHKVQRCGISAQPDHRLQNREPLKLSMLLLVGFAALIALAHPARAPQPTGWQRFN